MKNEKPPIRKNNVEVIIVQEYKIIKNVKEGGKKLNSLIEKTNFKKMKRIQ